MITTVSGPLVDAKDEARQAEVGTDLANAVVGLQRTVFSTVAAAVGLLIAVIGIATAIVLSRLP